VGRPKGRRKRQKEREKVFLLNPDYPTDRLASSICNQILHTSLSTMITDLRFIRKKEREVEGSTEDI
jgi:hypothetical protein